MTKRGVFVQALINGSFVTAKVEPDDIDAVILLPPDFQHQIKQGVEAALELEKMILTPSSRRNFCCGRRD